MLSYVIAVAVTLLISIPVTFVVTSAYRRPKSATPKTRQEKLLMMR